MLTGHTGFGQLDDGWLRHLGAEVIGISPAGGYCSVRADGAGIESHFCDIRDADRSLRVRDAQPQIAIHLAAQALVRASYCDPVGTCQQCDGER